MTTPDDLRAATAPAKTLREQLVAEGKQQDQSWPDWCAELIQAMGDFYGPKGPIEACGEDCWRAYYDDGYSADEAALEDMSYGDDDE